MELHDVQRRAIREYWQMFKERANELINERITSITESHEALMARISAAEDEIRALQASVNDLKTKVKQNG